MNVRTPAIAAGGSLTMTALPPHGTMPAAEGTIRAITIAALARAQAVEPGAAVNVSSPEVLAVDVVVIVPRLWVRRRRRSVIAGAVQYPARAAAAPATTVRVTVLERWRAGALF